MNTRGIYDTQGELLGYLVGDMVYDLDENPVDYLRDAVIYGLDGEKRWLVQGDGLYTPQYEAVGYLGSTYQEGR